MRRILSFATLLVIGSTSLSFIVGCQNDIIACDPLGCISENNFGNNIVSALKVSPGVTGYVVTVGAYPPKFGGNSNLTPVTAIVPDFQTMIASVSKMLTTFAVLKSLANHNISLDSSIFPYLYTDWQRVAGPNIQQLTFRDLLTHRSGFPVDEVNGQTTPNGCDGFNTGYSKLKSIIQANYAPLPAGVQGVYSNCNFAIFRELLPQMEGNNAINQTSDGFGGIVGGILSGFVPPSDLNPRAEQSAKFYIDYVNQNVLAPGLVSGTRSCSPTSNPLLQIWSYPPPPATTGATNWGDQTLTCGGSGWNMSAGDLTFVFNALAKGSLLTPAQQAQLYSGSGSNYPGLGWDNTIGYCPGANQNGKTYYWCKKGNEHNPAGAAIETFAGMFKCNSVPVVVIVNSPTTQDITVIVTSAFNARSTQANGIPQPCSNPRHQK